MAAKAAGQGREGLSLARVRSACGCVVCVKSVDASWESGDSWGSLLLLSAGGGLPHLSQGHGNICCLAEGTGSIGRVREGGAGGAGGVYGVGAGLVRIGPVVGREGCVLAVTWYVLHCAASVYAVRRSTAPEDAMLWPREEGRGHERGRRAALRRYVLGVLVYGGESYACSRSRLCLWLCRDRVGPVSLW